MRTYYDARPDETGFFPTPEGVTVRLRENVQESPTEDGTQWSADEYCVFIKGKIDAVRKRVEKSRELFLAQAKELEKPAVSKLTVEDLATAVMELGELFAEQDDALVELAEIIMEGK